MLKSYNDKKNKQKKKNAYQRPNQQPDTGSGIQIRYMFRYNHSSQSAQKGTLLPAQDSAETKTPSVLKMKILS